MHQPRVGDPPHRAAQPLNHLRPEGQPRRCRGTVRRHVHSAASWLGLGLGLGPVCIRTLTSPVSALSTVRAA
eukprot:8777194-Pyramimonas_sp.AAC.1